MVVLALKVQPRPVSPRGVFHFQPTMRFRCLSEAQAEELRAWASLWLIECADAGFMTPPYAADDAMIERALALYDAGLYPVEAAHVMFGKLH